ncbi:MAG: hypothetical protein CXT69_03485 [Methanobacteriota archaeon]|nr:MAG: hypothetical protein CXT69_03485 [Euryarchaeota archaeon]HIK78367.1 DEAD/DEAH box helicase [Candidatus Poseidoniales archaeon]
MEGSSSVDDLGLPSGVPQFLTNTWGITNLYPPQLEALPHVLSGGNTLVSIPTASGKSLVAYLGILQKLLVDEPKSRAIYIVPLKALASEKYAELKEIGGAFGLNVGLGIGDRDGEARFLDRGDIIVCTSEKLDSLMRTKPDLINNVSIVIADEFHLIHDMSRGPTMEVNLARLRHWRPKAQIIALSATIGNTPELADWLNAELIISQWRPVALEMSTLVEGCVEARRRIKSASDDGGMPLPPPKQLAGPASAPTWCVLLDTVEEEGQLLLFVSTRRSAQSEAKKLSKRMQKYLAKEDPTRLEKLGKLSSKIAEMSDSAMGDILVNSVKGGVAFHHAGLTSSQRRAVENGFKEGLITAICATPTLAAGVNLPARRCLVRDLKRWDDGMNRMLPVMEVQQMLGRAGRPRYDDLGQAWLLCKGSSALEEADIIAEKYIHGPPEDVTSKLAADPPMRVHLLSGIATGGLETRQAIRAFFKSTFLGHTQQEAMLEERTDRMLEWLIEEGFVERLGIDEELAEKFAQHAASDETGDEGDWQDELPQWVVQASATKGVELVEPNAQPNRQSTPSRRPIGKPILGFRKATSLEIGLPVTPEIKDPPAMKYRATSFGHRAAQLYIDPLSAAILRTGLRRAVRRIVRRNPDMDVSDFGLIHLSSATPDFLGFWPKDSERDRLHVKGSAEEYGMLIDISLEDRYLKAIKSSWILQNWTEESPSRQIEKVHGITPGDLRHRIDLMDWLLYSSKELIRVDNAFSSEHQEMVQALISRLDTLRTRIRHGCLEDILELIRLPNIGRVRARSLMNFGVRNPADLLALSPAKIAALKAKRGWGEKIVERMINEVHRITGRKRGASPKQREDDEVLPGERVD